jgi:hypothetical protein
MLNAPPCARILSLTGSEFQWLAFGFRHKNALPGRVEIVQLLENFVVLNETRLGTVTSVRTSGTTELHRGIAILTSLTG